MSNINLHSDSCTHITRMPDDLGLDALIDELAAAVASFNAHPDAPPAEGEAAWAMHHALLAKTGAMASVSLFLTPAFAEPTLGEILVHIEVNADGFAKIDLHGDGDGNYIHALNAEDARLLAKTIERAAELAERYYAAWGRENVEQAAA
jgi:hypothetical protein